VKPRAAYFPKKRLDFVKQSNVSWLFVANAPTFDSSQKTRLCEALNLYNLFVKPRVEKFPKKTFGTKPWSPSKRFILETEPKRRKRKARCHREKTKSMRFEFQDLEAKPTQTYDSIEK
jgi:hypothetical protein